MLSFIKKRILYKTTLSLLIVWLIMFQINAQNDISTDSNETSNSNSTVDHNTAIPLWLQQSQSQLDSFMNDTYNYFVTPNGNKVWVCSMNLAWNQLKRGFLSGKNALFQNTTNLQQHIVDNLNSQSFTREQLSQSTYYVASGYGNPAIEKINFQVKQKFPQKTIDNLEFNLGQKDFISYAYFLKNIQYKTPFSIRSDFQFKGTIVDSFYSSNSKQRSQLYYKYYNDNTDFLMGIYTQNQNDQILLLKSSHPEIKDFKLQKVLTLVKLCSEMPNQPLQKYDTFKMPVLDFDYTRSYEQMKKLQFINEGFENYSIGQMYERLKVKLNQNGVQVQSQAVIIMLMFFMSMDSKNFQFDNDFWLIMKEKNKKPYLIISVSSVKQEWNA